MAVDLGNDEVFSYKLNANKATITPNNPTAAFNTKSGTGPRLMAFHPNGRFAYLVHELGSIVEALAYDAQHGPFKEIQTLITLPSDYTGYNATAAIHISANGEFFYGSNRGHNSIVVYAINQQSGKMNVVEFAPTGGQDPRDFNLDLTGKFLLVANQNSNNIIT